ncbi:MAG: 50S ribosomal protein L30 [Acidobacteria bacterium]|nr:50S ribosomal protein L30 [Acidobacteriota bacterium]
MSGTTTIKIKQVASGIGRPEKHKRVLAALGLGKLHRVVELPDNAAIRGMVNTIPHLVIVVEDEDGGARR